MSSYACQVADAKNDEHVVAFYHSYYKIKFRAVMIRRRKKPWCADAWSSSSLMRFGGGGDSGGEETGGGGGEGGIMRKS